MLYGSKFPATKVSGFSKFVPSYYFKILPWGWAKYGI